MMIEKTIMICLALFRMSVLAWVVIFCKLHKTKFDWFQHGLIGVYVHHKIKVSAPWYSGTFAFHAMSPFRILIFCETDK